jgi:prevent-host-death family protein
MDQIGAFEAKTHFSELINRVEMGREEIIITKRGRPVAKLSPVPKDAEKSISDIFNEIDELRKGAVLGDDLSIRELIEDGRHR